MKKLLIIPFTVLTTISFFLISCGNTNTDAAMKAPLQNKADNASQKSNKESGENEVKENEKDDKTSTEKSASDVSTADAKIKTLENIQAAFKGETTASAKYAAYSKKAEHDGYHQIALLFKAASIAENIHANNHKAVLQESGVATPTIKPEFSVKTTKENLQDAITGETYEATTMYPEFLTVANTAGNQLAIISLNYAYKTEKKHKVMYENALVALQNNTVKSLPTVFYVCPTCGNTYETTAPKRCGISMTSGEKFLTITSL
ncbi:rubrerythrin family protein [Chitinophaga sp. LS1]|uniref:rubrerythrin family protein n=1 Tax=Chitinophaga sp. LS1 TaxID=3051176 RepID=UPI002AAB5132|nr:rubrerythrin family protein [Chitinophaga sp. LS1]WPV66345.1 rubrerythrin family protein [Chitinophaga sp. LS1]